jgi:hypothetical protein
MNLANDFKGTKDKILIALETSRIPVSVRELGSGLVAQAIRVGTVPGLDGRNAPVKMLSLMPKQGGV